jgi:ribonuclease E
MQTDIMVKKMLIDATHPEETRVVVVDGNKVEEFDFESENKRQLAGNIYLAKVTRVEPSLQAAFVDYGGNRHGFLAFAEIHPDYYQIPVADRIALMEEERAYADAQRVREEADTTRRAQPRPAPRAERATTEDAVTSADVAGMETIDLGDDAAPSAPEDVYSASDMADNATSPMERVGETPVEEPLDAGADAATLTGSDDDHADSDAAPEDAADHDAADADHDHDHDTDHAPENGHENGHENGSDRRGSRYAADKDSSIESVGDDDEDFRSSRKPRPRKYKIQEVIKVRQIMLVQVVKEERGNKGAALTTYLSLAGRYCVLMPNSERGGGISRKITNAADRKKLKEIAEEMQLPRGAGLIVRTAGAQRTKTEIKRDYEYLLRLWEQIRELTLKSIAPAKIYEEGDLIKRTIRDLYSAEIDEVLVEGERGFRNARDFMKMIMPTSASKVKLYREQMPLFARFQVESYLSSMFNPTVQLKSGGYIVIGVTEALVAIDVNSGRATKEGSIEETAVKTNLEAADEVARQLRLRDLAGLIVIDFIDMDDRKNNAAVEKRMKDKLKTDRARIQIGRISGFGLMEMSRQRLRPGMIEATTQPCAHCHGTGLVRSDDNLALSILRQIDEEGTRRRSREVLVRCPVAIANYLMNHKREHVATIEARYGMAVRVEGDPTLISPDFSLEKFKTATRLVPESHVVQADASLMNEVDEASAAEFAIEDAEVLDDVEAVTETDEATSTPAKSVPEASENGESKSKKKRRRRRRKPSLSRMTTDADGNVIAASDADDAGEDNADEGDDDADEGDDDADSPAVAAVASIEAVADMPAADTPVADGPPAKKTVTRSSSRRTKAKPAEVAAPDAATDAAVPAEAAETAETAPKKPSSRVRSSAAKVAASPEAAVETPKTPSPRSTAGRSRSKAAVADAAASATEPAATADVPVTVKAAPVRQIAVAVAADLQEPVAERPEPVVETIATAVVVQPVAAYAAPEAQPGSQPEIAAGSESEVDSKPKKRGWWNLGR